MKRKITMALGVTCVSGLLLAGCSSTPDTADAGGENGGGNEATSSNASWTPIDVNTWQDLTIDGEMQTVSYEPLDEASEPWEVCVSLPHMKDAYWLGSNYGAIDQAKILGINATVVEAGGYENLPTQIQQIEDCMQSADALVVGAISSEGLNTTLDRIAAEGKPVIDVANGVSTDSISGKVLVSWLHLTAVVGEYLLEETAGEDVEIAWFPGPSGSAWAEDGDQGIKEVLEGTNVTIAETKWGDTGKELQTQLIEDTLAAVPNIKYIVGTAVTAEAAGPILRERGLEDEIKVIGTYFSPGVYQGIQNGTVVAAPNDAVSLQTRIAMDMAVRALEGKADAVRVQPALAMVDSSNVDEFDSSTALAPDGWKPEFTVTAQ